MCTHGFGLEVNVTYFTVRMFQVKTALALDELMFSPLQKKCGSTQSANSQNIKMILPPLNTCGRRGRGRDDAPHGSLSVSAQTSSPEGGSGAGSGHRASSGRSSLVDASGKTCPCQHAAKHTRVCLLKSLTQTNSENIGKGSVKTEVFSCVTVQTLIVSMWPQKGQKFLK